MPPTLVELAKNPIKVGDSAPNFRLTVGGEDLSNRLVQAEVTYSASGESGMTFTVGKNLYLHSRERQFVNLEIGYGNTLVPFFLGRLSTPKDHRSGLYSEATAYGPSGDLGSRYFRGRVSYANFDAMVAALDIWNRCMGGDNSSAQFIWDAPSTVLEGELEQFGLEHSFLEALQACLEPLGLIGCDQPNGNFLVTEPMKTGALVGGGLHGTWGMGSVPFEPGFVFGESGRNIYNNVVVFRRSEEYAGGSEAGAGQPGMLPFEDGWVPAEWYGSSAQNESNVVEAPESEYAVYAERPVGDSQFRRRPYLIPDYPGRQEAAQQLAEKIAATLNLGVGRFEVEIAPCDYALYDLFGVEQEQQEVPFGDVSGPLWNVLYACQIEEIGLTIAPSTYRMTLSGAACERSRTLIRPGGIATGSSSGVIAA
jgi:hypothetical protein